MRCVSVAVSGGHLQTCQAAEMGSQGYLRAIRRCRVLLYGGCEAVERDVTSHYQQSTDCGYDTSVRDAPEYNGSR